MINVGTTNEKNSYGKKKVKQSTTTGVEPAIFRSEVERLIH